MIVLLVGLFFLLLLFFSFFGGNMIEKGLKKIRRRKQSLSPGMTSPFGMYILDEMCGRKEEGPAGD